MNMGSLRTSVKRERGLKGTKKIRRREPAKSCVEICEYSLKCQTKRKNKIWQVLSRTKNLYLADFLDDLEVSIRELSVDGKCCSYYSTRVGLCN